MGKCSMSCLIQAKVMIEDVTQLSFSERTSNGSFISDTISNEEVFHAWMD